MEGGNAANRIAHARDRSTSNRCSEFQKFNYPLAWTVPCVLAWEAWPDTKVKHLEQFHDGCWKSCIQSEIGTQRAMPLNLALFVNALELHNFTKLQQLQPAAHEYMLCGGKSWWDKSGEQVDPIYWASDSNNMAPTCGRCIRISERRISGWCRKKSLSLIHISEPTRPY